MIRRIREEDTKAIAKLLEQLSGKTKIDNLVLEKMLSSDDYYCACEDDKKHGIIGMATLHIEQKLIHDCRPVGHIEDVVVDSKHRKKGICKKLLKVLVNQAKQWDCYKVLLNCSKENIPVYEGCGFKQYDIGMRLNIN